MKHWIRLDRDLPTCILQLLQTVDEHAEKSWMEIGKMVGLEVIDDEEEVEEEEGDAEVAKIWEKNKQSHNKLLKGRIL